MFIHHSGGKRVIKSDSKKINVFVIDSCAIFMKKRYKDMITVPEVIEEIKDENSKLFLSIIDLRVENAELEFIEKVKNIATESGDIHKLSDTDIKLIAKALELKEKGAVLVTDDYAIQNIASLLNIQVDNILQPTIGKTYRWTRVCRGCGREVDTETCPVCGSETYLRKEDIGKDII